VAADQAEIDRSYLSRAIELSASQVRGGNGGPFGAVIVLGGAVVAEGCNEVTSTPDPTAHAEIVAIRRACMAIGDFSLAGATIYASCEPCPMCLAAIYWARIERLVFANTREEAAAIGFDDAMIYEEIPKEIHQRRLRTLHLPLEEGAAVFEEWRAKPDKIPY
jgi:tRNA(Arg) A34 adenosine deaminase TadA